MYAVGMHFGTYGRISPTTIIGATWTCRQHDLDCGEMVFLTHPTVVDVAEGTVGVTDRVAVVVSRRNSLTDRQADSIGVLLPVVSNVGEIAPCALADPNDVGTGWVVGTLTLTFGATNHYAPAGETDLTHFEAGMTVLVTEYDARIPAQAAAVIQSVGANTIVFTADPFGGAGMPATGVWVHYPTYPASSAAQQAWLYFADTSYGLGAAPDPGYRWGI